MGLDAGCAQGMVVHRDLVQAAGRVGVVPVTVAADGDTRARIEDRFAVGSGGDHDAVDVELGRGRVFGQHQVVPAIVGHRARALELVGEGLADRLRAGVGLATGEGGGQALLEVQVVAGQARPQHRLESHRPGLDPPLHTQGPGGLQRRSAAELEVPTRAVEGHRRPGHGVALAAGNAAADLGVVAASNVTCTATGRFVQRPVRDGPVGQHLLAVEVVGGGGQAIGNLERRGGGVAEAIRAGRRAFVATRYRISV